MHFGETRSHVTLDGTGKTGKTASMGGSAVRRFRIVEGRPRNSHSAVLFRAEIY